MKVEVMNLWDTVLQKSEEISTITAYIPEKQKTEEDQEYLRSYVRQWTKLLLNWLAYIVYIK